MRDQLVATVKKSLARYGYELNRITTVPATAPAQHDLPLDFDDATSATVRFVSGYTMTSPERLFALCHAIRYISAAEIPGAIVECGVWKGGSMMAAARTLLEVGDTDRELYLFDTFEGMPAPTEHDVDLVGVSAYEKWQTYKRNPLVPREARAGLRGVEEAVRSVGYDMSRVHFVKGMVEDTIPGAAPDRIALLRLDTDYYQSTRHEMFELYPRLVPRGVLIIDDFGHFRGSEQAVREYFDATGEQVLLHRVDYSARLVVKP